LDNGIYNFGGFGAIGKDMRYNACNLASLNTFGSIEIRTMRGADCVGDVLEWLDIMNQLYKYAVNDCPNPRRMVENLSYLGAEGFLRQFFDEPTIAKLMRAWPPLKDFNRSLMDGVRLVQMLAYKMDEAWQAEAPKVEEAPVFKKEPFGRAAFEPGGHPNDRVVLPDGRHWHVPLRDLVAHGDVDHTPNGEIVFNTHLGYWIDRNTGLVLRWKVRSGRLLAFGSRIERDLNRVWYREQRPEPVLNEWGDPIDHDDDDDDDDEE
jgi:hypothetical protein